MKRGAPAIVGRLAIEGGAAVCAGPPPRRAFGEAELAMVTRVFEDAWAAGRDFATQGTYETQFCERFAAYHGGGFADAVGSGSAAIYVGLAAFELPKGSEVVVLPMADPAAAMAATLLGLRPVVCDAAPGGYNADTVTIAAVLSDQTRLLVLAHAGGFPVDMQPVMELANARGLAVIEDVSQAHGARRSGRLVGTFGDLLVASTGPDETLATGGKGGVIWTRDENRYAKVRAYADRGKTFPNGEAEGGEAATLQFPSLDVNQDELSAAIGISLLGRLDAINRRRSALWNRIRDGLKDCRAVELCAPPADVDPAFAFAPVHFREGVLRVGKRAFAEALAAEGVWLNPHCRDLVAEWPWYRRLTNKAYITPAAQAFRDATFNLLFHEGYGDADADAVAAAVRKVEAAYAR